MFLRRRPKGYQDGGSIMGARQAPWQGPPEPSRIGMEDPMAALTGLGQRPTFDMDVPPIAVTPPEEGPSVEEMIDVATSMGLGRGTLSIEGDKVEFTLPLQKRRIRDGNKPNRGYYKRGR